MNSSEKIIEQTKKWINDVVIGCNFCPFAAKVIRQKTVQYRVAEKITSALCMVLMLEEMNRLDKDMNIETSFLIFPDSFGDFNEYLKLVDEGEKLIKKNGYEGIYQLASFHPLYRFADSLENDAADYTNRSVYPMLHLLREKSIQKALLHYENPESIPAVNINFTRKKGQAYLKMLRDACLND